MSYGSVANDLKEIECDSDQLADGGQMVALRE
jgi:hypothetical protein